MDVDHNEMILETVSMPAHLDEEIADIAGRTSRSRADIMRFCVQTVADDNLELVPAPTDESKAGMVEQPVFIPLALDRRLKVLGAALEQSKGEIIRRCIESVLRRHRLSETGLGPPKSGGPIPNL